ncbi:MAG: HaeII family restriction endonuclease [archaeon]
MKSKDALDKIIRKSRVHLYKPIQIAEILYAYRIKKEINPSDLESYRNVSKKWRDEISKRLIGRICTSSQKFQDNIFEGNAMPPALLKELADFNTKHGGMVENYIYHQLFARLNMVFDAFKYIKTATPETFDLGSFLALFTEKAGLKRSIDKAYEITVYALFNTIVRALKVETTLSINNSDEQIMSDFEKFLALVLGLSKKQKRITAPARLYRVGVTNAADRGLDMWTNFGPAIQVKHISLSEELAEDVSENISADKIVLVCLDGEADLVRKIMTQLPFSSKIQGIITISNLKEWYSLCLSKKYKKTLGKQLLQDLKREFNFEFPSTSEIAPFLEERKYLAKALNDEWSISDLD